MTLIIAGRPLEQADGLSETARTVLGLIDGGVNWVQWAIQAPNANYAFADETALVQGVQAGLHGRDAAFLPTLGLTVGPGRLMTLGLAQLTALAKAESSGKVPATARKILAAAGLLTAADLAAGTAWLAGQGIADAAVFAGADLTDRIALADLAAADKAEPALGREASAFAIAEARTPGEFADYRRLYLALAARPGATTPGERQALARSSLDLLLPWMFTALDTPRISPVAWSEVGPALEDWMRQGRRLGFHSAAAGARQICENTAFAPDTNEAAALISSYLAGAAAVISTGPLPPAALGQDGQALSFRIEQGGKVAELSVSALGDLALENFQPTEPA
ncbi:hypothetical protein QO010_000564 [Caulobacter ginsengisoli]|uniref:Uncharacterized protein n=1 Tax=Caulobacter ginsengisoli TaxID=400775 RepID=A0ABU0ILC8_9CAUL|nr:hypothetical protein [Caulobacter ginsengisoli]MDQ0462816.1 hypothetical protein [Caulobacter ginsengisoli]